jgi:hypothetical protein
MILINNSPSFTLLEPVSFKWSTSEQIYPHEYDMYGRILYCKELVLGMLPSLGNITAAHGIYFNGIQTPVTKIFRCESWVLGNIWANGSLTDWNRTTFFKITPNTGFQLFEVDESNITFNRTTNLEPQYHERYEAFCRVIYAKDDHS